MTRIDWDLASALVLNVKRVAQTETESPTSTTETEPDTITLTSGPTFTSTSTPMPTKTMTPTPDEGYFPSLSNLSSNKKWFGGAIAVVILFGICVAVFFWVRRMGGLKNMFRFRRTGEYESLPLDVDDEPVPMTGFGAGSRVSRHPTAAPISGAPPHAPIRSGRLTSTRELYDAFGEVSDSDSDNEETRLNPDTRRRPGDRENGTRV
ncbi:hypothetical protein BDP27DRAFT_1426731 [Rhodocollybia butyracea]|uniref:Uncharacterized protein n=1 Tax=Rhodocollybia butyracea TaxID=206335 RepID=A0A9P5PGP9_9AGAR|nr:hypothetical protein BDP27DRAFT_1426731 [Rhodocollybia butyracea]